MKICVYSDEGQCSLFEPCPDGDNDCFSCDSDGYCDGRDISCLNYTNKLI